MGRTSLFIYIGILLALATGSAVFLAKPIKKGLGNISDWVHTMSTGDLTKYADIRTKDEIGDMASGLKDMVEKVKKVITQTIEASNQVSTAADQIAEANQNFSQRITEQAASVEETSSTMEEMSASIRQTADNAREANKLAQSAKASAEAGIKVMGDTISAMDEINRSSSKIANISNVIEEIAFQTNLLALNAAVEAARAGEHGKGFAVVASEIRSLAQRAAQSAKEITELIEDSVEKTGKGVQLAQELNKKLEEISIGVKKVADLMDEVAASAQEQASGINQVNTAVTQIDQMTQQNAALVEETSASAEELASQAKELMNLISFFRVDETFSAEREVRPVKKTIQRPQPVLVHASASSRREVVSEQKSNGGFEEF
jgi:methyl-accepting chemotaxis protein